MQIDPDYDNMEKRMREVFDQAIVKAQLACGKKGNTDKPWKDFSIEWLRKRLDDEIKEYESKERTGKTDWIELIDVINIACFLYLAHYGDWLKRSVEIMNDGNA